MNSYVILRTDVLKGVIDALGKVCLQCKFILHPKDGLSCLTIDWREDCAVQIHIDSTDFVCSEIPDKIEFHVYLDNFNAAFQEMKNNVTYCKYIPLQHQLITLTIVPENNKEKKKTSSRVSSSSSSHTTFTNESFVHEKVYDLKMEIDYEDIYSEQLINFPLVNSETFPYTISLSPDDLANESVHGLMDATFVYIGIVPFVPLLYLYSECNGKAEKLIPVQAMKEHHPGINISDPSKDIRVYITRTRERKKIEHELQSCQEMKNDVIQGQIEDHNIQYITQRHFIKYIHACINCRIHQYKSKHLIMGFSPLYGMVMNYVIEKNSFVQYRFLTGLPKQALINQIKERAATYETSRIKRSIFAPLPSFLKTHIVEKVRLASTK